MPIGAIPMGGGMGGIGPMKPILGPGPPTGIGGTTGVVCVLPVLDVDSSSLSSPPLAAKAEILHQWAFLIRIMITFLMFNN